MTPREELLGRSYWTPAEAARMLERDKSTITRWIAAGLPSYDVRGSRYVRAEEVRDWAADPTRRTRRRLRG